jgi:hypothetical protein
MKSYKTTPFVALCLLVLLFGCEADAQTRKAVKNNSQSQSKEQRWEYCVVSLNGSVTTASNKFIGQAFIAYLNESNKPDVRIEVTDFPSDNNLSKRKALSKAFAQLGNGGWELIGRFPFVYDYGSEDSGFFFKRKKQ